MSQSDLRHGAWFSAALIVASLFAFGIAPLSAQTAPDTVRTRFAIGSTAAAIPFELYNNHILVKVRVGTSAPLVFILDTGANETVLSTSAAALLGLRLQSVGQVHGGIGKAPHAYQITDNLTFEMQGVAMEGMSAVAMSLEATTACVGQHTKRDAPTRDIDGVLGYSFFRRVVVEIDYEARVLNLYAPEAFEYAGKGTSVPLELESQLIFARGRIKAAGRPPIAARLLIDTGSGTDLSITDRFTAAHQLLRTQSKLIPSAECGVGGMASRKNVVGAIEALEIGGLSLSHPTTVFNQRPAAPGYDGLVGNTALQHFKVLFDYPHKRMILQ